MDAVIVGKDSVNSYNTRLSKNGKSVLAKTHFSFSVQTYTHFNNNRASSITIKSFVVKRL